MNTLNQVIDCSILPTNEINTSVKELIAHSIKNVILKNADKKENLLERIAGNIKVEVFGNTGPFFANDTSGLKITVNGNIRNNSAGAIKQGKITVFGSCENNFGNNVRACEFYVFDNCGSDCFSNLTNLSSVVIGGQAGKNFASELNEGKIVILNLKGGTMFIDDSLNWLDNYKDGLVYIRGSYKLNTNKFLVQETNEKDEDVYLPLISEFARLFNYSLSSIKSKPFYRIKL